MKPISSLGYMHLTMLAKPVSDREIYKTVRRNKFQSFIEIGMGNGSRAMNLIRVAQKFGGAENIKYTGIDGFDGRDESQTPLSLLEMHRQLKAVKGAKTQLVPGDLKPAISRIANSHVRTDLIVISQGFDPEELSKTWFYFPRMLHAGSIVMVQRKAEGPFKRLNRLQVEKLSEREFSKRVIAA